VLTARLKQEFIYSDRNIGTYPIDIELLVDMPPVRHTARERARARERDEQPLTEYICLWCGVCMCVERGRAAWTVWRSEGRPVEEPYQTSA